MSDECYTPAEYIHAARCVLGAIDLDPASNEVANEVVRARRFYTIDDDGLSKRKRWRGRVWMNPPYSDPAPWVDKLIAAYQCGDVSAAVALFNARTGSQWFDRMARQAWRCETFKRIRFYGPGTTGGHGMQDQCFFYLGHEPARFKAHFETFGRIVQPSLLDLFGSVTRGVTCAVCSRALDGYRKDASVCSSKCKQRRYRDRLRA